MVLATAKIEDFDRFWNTSNRTGHDRPGTSHGFKECHRKPFRQGRQDHDIDRAENRLDVRSETKKRDATGEPEVGNHSIEHGAVAVPRELCSDCHKRAVFAGSDNLSGCM